MESDGHEGRVSVKVTTLQGQEFIFKLKKNNSMITLASMIRQELGLAYFQLVAATGETVCQDDRKVRQLRSVHLQVVQVIPCISSHQDGLMVWYPGCDLVFVLHGYKKRVTVDHRNYDEIQAKVRRKKSPLKVTSTNNSFWVTYSDDSAERWTYAPGAWPSLNENGEPQIIAMSSNNFATATIRSDGSVKTVWEDPSRIGGEEYPGRLGVGLVYGRVVAIRSNQDAFAALHDTGRIVTWGSRRAGGGMQLQVEAVAIQCTYFSFCAILRDTSLVAWGEPLEGGLLPTNLQQLRGIVAVQATARAFAALLDTGFVLSWGMAAYGGDSSEVRTYLKEIVAIQSSEDTFAALSRSGEVTTWGHFQRRIELEGCAVKAVQANIGAFVALRDNGKIQVWGHPTHGGVATPEAHDRCGSNTKQ